MQKSKEVTKANQRHISKVAVLGSGVMGSRIACHFANIGLEVLLLDIVPFDIKEEDKDKKAVRNSIVNGALKSTLKSNPSPIYDKKFANRITTGNFDDDLAKIKDCDRHTKNRKYYQATFNHCMIIDIHCSKSC